MLTIDFDVLPIGSGEQVLDIGCGPGRHSWYICTLDHCSVCAMDYDLEPLQTAKGMLAAMDDENQTKGKWNVLQGNAMGLPFRDGTFDKIVCSEVLEHVLDDEQGVRELVRVLKNEGKLAVSVPCHFMESLYWKISEDYHTNPGGHIRIYHEHELIDMLQRNNLTVYAIRHRHAFHSIYWLLRCIFGVRREKALVPSLYHKFLAWEITNKNWFFVRLEGLLDHLFPKSVVIYTHKKPK
ncbi:MAG: class I SAM-dependent methyltransferase [Chloroflexota bacterium]|nr:class I SAM-dependent methyltransferase [Chloroflexota bacterium]